MRRTTHTKRKKKFSLVSPSAFLLLIITQVVFILYMVGQLFLFIPYTASKEYAPSDAARRFATYDVKLVPISSETYTLYIADTDAKRIQGLSRVTSMHPFEGMAFVFDTPTYQGFWMKDMHMALDFIFVQDSVVIDIIEDVSPDTYPESIFPQGPADMVIELGSEEVERSGARIGDVINL